MDWPTYKRLSHETEYFTRVALIRTASYIEPRVATTLKRFTESTPLEKPVDHKGGPETDVFKIQLSQEDIATILADLENARARLKLEQGSSQPNLGPLIALWQEHADWLKVHADKH